MPTLRTMRFRLHSLSTPLRLLGLSLSVALATGCSSSGDEGAGASSSTIPGEPIAASGRYDLRADVKAIDATAWDPMVVSHEGAGVWLKPEARGAEWLKPGTVTLIKQRGVLKVGSVTEEGDHLVVENVPADWSEIFENGDFSIGGRTRFDLPFSDDPSELGVRDNGAAPVENSAPPPAEPEGAPGAGTQSRPLSVSPLTVAPLGLGKSLLDNVKSLATDGWKVEKHVTGDGDELHYDITLSKDSGGLLARIHAVGTVRNLQTALKVAVQNRVTEQNVFDVHSSGDADLTWEVGISEGSVGYNKIVLPGTSFKQQFFVGEIPMVLKVKTGMAIIVGATGRNSTTTGRVHVEYTSDGGVHVTPSGGDSNATGTGDASYADERGTLTVGPSAFGFVATLPRIELGVGIDSLFVSGPYFSNTSTNILKSRGGIGGNPCSDIEMKFEGNVGLFVDAGMAGKLLTKGVEKAGAKLSKKIYEVNKTAQSCGLK